MADLWEDMGIAAVPGLEGKEKYNVLSSCAFLGKGPVVPVLQSSSADHRPGPNSSKHFLLSLSEGRRSWSA